MVHSGSMVIWKPPDPPPAPGGATAVTVSNASASRIPGTLTGVRCTSELTRVRSRHGCGRGNHHVRRARVEADGVHPLRVQLRDRGELGVARARPEVRAHPGRQESPVVAGLHLREGAPPRPLPEPRWTTRARSATRAGPRWAGDPPAAAAARRQPRGERL